MDFEVQRREADKGNNLKGYGLSRRQTITEISVKRTDMQKPRNRLNLKARKSSGPKAESCFVIMPFGYPFDQYYLDILVPAIMSLGLTPIRADSLFRSSSIILDIWGLIRNANVLLADLSGQNANVLYELGLAHAFNKPVILLAEKIEDVPSDLKELRVILYDKDHSNWGDELRRRIEQALSETISNVKSTAPKVFCSSLPALGRFSPGSRAAAARNKRRA